MQLEYAIHKDVDNMKQWHFYEKVYRRWVVLMICSLEELKDELRTFEYKYTDDLYDAKGMVIELNKDNNDVGQYCEIIWLKEWETATLVHELSHLVMISFEQVRVPIGNDNTEAFAFYLEYWWAEINRIRKRFPDGRSSKQARNN